MITEALLRAVMPRAGASAAIWCEPLRIAAARFEINTPLRLAAWLATLGHESLDLTALEENLNYSAEGLVRTWPNRFSVTGLPGGAPNDVALAIARKPQAIANNVYANRMGNGPPESGDGWNFRGRCPIQATGRAMYRAAAIATGYALETNPDLANEPTPGALVAAWIFAVEKQCNDDADRGDFDAVSDLINRGRMTPVYGDAIGYQDRFKRYVTCKKELGA